MIDISVLDYILSLTVTYLVGVGTGLTICCKYKDKFMSRTSSKDDLSQMHPIPPVIEASAPPVSHVPGIKVTYE